jgi:Na+/H+-translocating membrane pyrophosphatase
MGTFATVAIGIIIGAIADHYFEARSLAAIKKLIAEAERRIIDEIRKLSSGV